MAKKNFDVNVCEPDGSVYLELKATGTFSADGKPIFDSDSDGRAILQPIKFGNIIGNLLKNSTGGKELSCDEYIARWELMRKVAEGGMIEMSSDGKDVDIIRDLLIKAKLSPFITGQICEYLNKNETTETN